MNKEVLTHRQSDKKEKRGDGEQGKASLACVSETLLGH